MSQYQSFYFILYDQPQQFFETYQKSNQAYLLEELDEFRKNPIPGISIEPYADDMLHLKAYIDGPPNSVYEDARFEIDIVVPPEYPVKAPTCRAI